MKFIFCEYVNETGGRRYCTVVRFGPLVVIKACCNGFAMHSVFIELSFCKEPSPALLHIRTGDGNSEKVLPH